MSVANISTISYSFLNFPEIVKLNNGSIRYIYTSSGQKLAQIVLDKEIIKQTDYSGEYIYQNDTLQFINHEEGRVVMTGVDPEYQYHLKDHLGNVRVTFTTKQDIEENTATLETANATTEQSQFLYYDEAVKINSTLFDHTNNGATQYSTRLSGSPNELTGLAKSISVMPGDTIRTEVYAKYLDGNTSNWTTALTNFMAAIAGGTAPAGTFVDGGATGSTGGTTPSFIGLLDKGDETGNAPKAYLNYLIFDKNYVLLNGGFVRMSENAREYGQDGAHEKLAAEFVITEPGYVYIYLSNDNAALGGSTIEVYFDDFTVTHTKSPVIQSNDYYPFGLAFNSYSRENSIANQYLYNGKEKQDELGLDWLDYGARMYMPELGRWGVIDPLANRAYNASPYNYAINNPINFIDFKGKFPIPVVYLAYEGLLFAFTATAGLLIIHNHEELNTGIYFGQSISVLEARGKANDPYWAKYVWKNNRGVALDVGQLMGFDLEPKPDPNSKDNKPGSSFRRGAIAFLSLAALSAYQEYKSLIKKEIRESTRMINQRIDAIYDRLDEIDPDSEEFNNLVEEKSMLWALRTENQQHEQALDSYERVLEDTYKQTRHSQDATRRTDNNYSKEFLDWYYKKRDNK